MRRVVEAWLSAGRDSLAPVPVLYYLVVHDQLVQLFRSAGARTVLLWEESVTDADPMASAQALTAIINRQWSTHRPRAGLYLLLNNRHAFSHVSSAPEFSGDTVVQRVAACQSDRAGITYTLLPNGSEQRFILQGVDRDYLSHVTAWCKDTSIPLIGISTVPAFLATHGLSKISPLGAMTRLNWSTASAIETAIISKSTGEYGVLTPGTDANVTRDGEVAEVINIVTAKKLMLTRQKGSTSTKGGQLLPSRPVLTGSAAALSFKPPQSRMWLGGYLSQNVLRLVSMFLLIVTIVSLGVSALVNVGAAERARTIASYESLELQFRSLDQLAQLAAKTESADARRSLEAPVSLGLSAFCQGKPEGVALTSITVRSAMDSVSVEATGTARTESAVFALLDSAKASFSPWQVELAQLRPQVVARGGLPDTVIGFRLQVVGHE